MHIRGATTLRGGAVVLHMNSAQAADWMRVPVQMEAFLAGMGGTSIFKERAASVVVEFVPVSFDPSLDGALRVLEDDNGWRRGVLTQARYIKPFQRRRVGQMTAHAIFGFLTRDAANHIIEHGLFVEGKAVKARKLLSEPIRCLKCQVVGANHTARECPSIHDVCARCGEMHPTADCVVPEVVRACSNC
ncbi:hypothetical protein B0H10DRAFT_1789805 [Mycena sp. CBHHK59/15]|nr:hypothetical protein B0H10DRAFT_1789805 [Mycena sp. CBHHK59/15]